MLGLGFGFVEVGTLTPRPQAGNPKPRLFRLGRGPGGDQPHGLQQSRARPPRSSGCGTRERRGIVGVNIGANKDSADRIADYAAGVRAMAPVADYLTVNISSPNTPGLRELQDEGALDELLAAVREARAAAVRRSSSRSRPTSSEGDPERSSASRSTSGIDALIVANTTDLAAAAASRASPARRAGCPARR